MTGLLKPMKTIKDLIQSNDHKALIDYKSLGKAVNPGAFLLPAHFLPLLYSLALKEENETINIFNDKAVGVLLTMTSVKIGD